MVMLAWATKTNNSAKFAEQEKDIVSTPQFTAPDKHLIKVTACWRGMESTAPAIVTLSITDEGNGHKQEQSLRIATEGVGQAGGEMSRVLRVLTSGGDIIPGRQLFKLRAKRERGPGPGTGTVFLQAAETYPTQIRVEDLGSI
jgi:hypothetical protein